MVNEMMKKEVCGENVSIVGNRCYRCKHFWIPRDPKKQPVTCPKCKSPFWKTPKQRITKKRLKEK
jgi:predicted Zn-ribbon and HTH transcriptional regulator